MISWESQVERRHTRSTRLFKAVKLSLTRNLVDVRKDGLPVGMLRLFVLMAHTVVIAGPAPTGFFFFWVCGFR